MTGVSLMYLFYSGSKSYRCRAMANLFNDIQRDKLIYGTQRGADHILVTKWCKALKFD